MIDIDTESVPEIIEEAVEVETTTPLAKIKDENLIRMRQKLEAAEEAKMASDKRAEEAERRAQYRIETPASEQPEESIDVEDEDYVQAKHVKKGNKKVTSELKAIREEMQQLRQDNILLRAEKATDKISDFNDVVSTDNLKTLQRLYPDDYETVMSNPNLKSKSVTAYNMILRYGIAEQKDKEMAQMKVVDRKIDEIRSRPGSASNARTSASPLTAASRYDSDGRLNLTPTDIDRINRDMRRKMGYE
jgi:hypothetical protein